ncbi:transmembrane protein, putative (macronuclear) [Tetrahymena thermophila SB210]|uniref:Transmembrane protein, putative n=1 Tax=Tetrahymena thermophila (strain SB210) TaxID=312017 RepID=W7XKT6_TETTS|nr:transmembrane protein, putative [Tetrahymena thermophila SB210]EWS75209.1 transmembrane protein, putative [Tetrahymena thermophila SB210]|eukprot:XP_012652200.1 transmembrane protein, putative [Tetrahymena thermophila SB210]
MLYQLCQIVKSPSFAYLQVSQLKTLFLIYFTLVLSFIQIGSNIFSIEKNATREQKSVFYKIASQKNNSIFSFLFKFFLQATFLQVFFFDQILIIHQQLHCLIFKAGLNQFFTLNQLSLLFFGIQVIACVVSINVTEIK